MGLKPLPERESCLRWHIANIVEDSPVPAPALAHDIAVRGLVTSTYSPEADTMAT
ncbi:hypothetical protein [Flaviflexus huanghaiensis]|uniref:hypothetical protein n=1 Tax=Flaviflexus huanghaiensis TaxID=1111473 RepID=UPI0015FC9622|nr:hypothetical protein [Flaviflexus huanghaiensis]